MRVFWISLALVLSTACGGGDDDKSTEDDTNTADDTNTDGSDTDGDDDDDDDDDDGWNDPGDGESPATRNGEVYCCTIGGDANIVTFFASLEFEDPQGNSTVENAWTVNAEISGTLINAIPMYGCQVDGTCAASWGESYYDVSCDNIENYDFTAVIEDADGNVGTADLEVIPWTDTGGC